MKKVHLIIPGVLLFIGICSFKNKNEYRLNTVKESTICNSVIFDFVVHNTTTNIIETIITVDNGAYSTGTRDTGPNSSNRIDGVAPADTNQTIAIEFTGNVPPHVECCGQIKTPVNGIVIFTGISIPNNGDLGIYLF